jgi:DNA-binding IclR family transcriptional regulator
VTYSTVTDTTRSLSRAVKILRVLAGPHANGLALTDISKLTEIPHPTVHRLLRHLVVDRLVSIRQQHRYVLGPLAFELGLAAASWFDFRSRYQKSMQTLCDITGETIYLTARSGFDAVCVDRKEGIPPLTGLMTNIGSRRPLGVGTGGLAIISKLPKEEIEKIVVENTKRLNQFKNFTPLKLRQSIAETQARGYAVTCNLLTLGVTVVGVPLFDDREQAYGALCAASTNERMRVSRQVTVAQFLRDEADRMGKSPYGQPRSG